MGKIKGWAKTGKYYYRNDKTNAMLQIGWNNPNDIIVLVEQTGQKPVKIHNGTFFSEKNARKEALNYMRSHPNG